MLHIIDMETGDFVVVESQASVEEGFEAVFDVVTLEDSGVGVLGWREVVAEAESSVLRGGLEECWRWGLLVACAVWAGVRWLQDGAWVCGGDGWEAWDAGNYG